ncbi:MAG: PKD domain-containing protein [Saprospiraceae bacterium]|nr:PKD domain-containing protein [Saprospiraceae bacterium]
MLKNYLISVRLSILLIFLVGLVGIHSCTKDNFKPRETAKELMATASSNITVAEGGAITFTDLSLGVANRRWTFPGGTPSTSQLPVVDVVFSEEGTIVCTLEIEYFDGTKESKNFNIQVYPVLIAAFTPSATRIKVGETVTFTDNSIGSPTSWSWEFEGGTPATSTEQNPTVTFNVNQPVTVKLTIERAIDGSSVTEEKINLIQVGPPELCLNGNFETGIGNVVDWQTWNGAPFPYTVVAGGANGTNYSSFIDFQGAWGWGQIISRDFPNNKIALENGKDYKVSMYVKAESPIRLDAFRGVNHLPDWSAAYAGIAEGYEEFYDNSGFSLPYNITTEWTKVEIQISVPNDGNSRTNFFPDIIFGGAANSKVYIDEISVKIVE